MALFGKKEEEKKDKAPVAEEKATAAPKKADKKSEKKTEKSKASDRRYTKAPGHILKKPYITEKAAYGIERGAYVFEVAPDATKRDVAAMITEVYKVTPRKVNIIRRQPRVKVSRSRRRWGTIPGMKKAIVFLKKGDKIDIV